MGSENIQLELLKQRIEYDEKIFGEAKEYYEFVDRTFVNTAESNDIISGATSAPHSGGSF